MKRIHVECLPDETLLKQLGFSKKSITHHSGKSRVFKKLQSVKNEVAMVDEDPGSAKHPYENKLKRIETKEGISKYTDASGNIVVVLEGKLEDWIVSVCKKDKVKLDSFNLPDNPDKLHDKINYSLPHFEKLVKHLKDTNNKAIQYLTDCLK
jgi:hypothetical protein